MIQIFKKDKNDLLKIIAVISMFIDHIGLSLFPQYKIFRIIGRIAFPIFCYHIALGAYHTKNINEYIKRIFLLGILSQIPFMLLINTKRGILNINNFKLDTMFSFFIGLLVIRNINLKKYLYIIPLIPIPFLFPLSYGVYGILMVLGFYFLRDFPMIAVETTIFLTIIYSFLNSYIQFFAIIILLLIPLLIRVKQKINLPKYFFYIFYPVHMIIIWIVHLVVN